MYKTPHTSVANILQYGLWLTLLFATLWLCARTRLFSLVALMGVAGVRRNSPCGPSSPSQLTVRLRRTDSGVDAGSCSGSRE
ncbi:uncharacterized protein B0H18DRAFT_17283 [Fomitopsis serialis]|uniref:uncharacterized protein n=1 Tax=Fomitopsis serialis TaxID=139415 RepID=UPI0020088D3A|nr:uncharacterized protein B0H18DRAFT_17283 [Neoantrodia serialis]KAH9938497.1 hypothetical protein B0H18DRAFT_17283 [Neoantrodia serialis]